MDYYYYYHYYYYYAYRLLLFQYWLAAFEDCDFFYTDPELTKWKCV